MADDKTPQTTPAGEQPAPTEAQPSQADINKIVQDRLARERSKFEKDLQSAGFSSIDELKTFRQQQAQSKAEAEEAQRKQLAEQQQYKTLYEQDKKQWSEREAELERQLNEQQSQAAAALSRANTAQITRDVVAAAGASGAVAPDQVAQLLAGRMSVDEHGRTVVLGDDGQPATDGKGNLLGVQGFVTQFLQDNPHHVRAAPAGAGSRPSAGGSGLSADLKAVLASGNPELINKHSEEIKRAAFG